MKRITETLLVKLEQKAKMVQSELDPNLYYGIDRTGKGMWLVVNGVEIPLAVQDIKPFTEEITSVWETMGVRG